MFPSNGASHLSMTQYTPCWQTFYNCFTKYASISTLPKLSRRLEARGRKINRYLEIYQVYKEKNKVNQLLGTKSIKGSLKTNFSFHQLGLEKATFLQEKLDTRCKVQQVLHQLPTYLQKQFTYSVVEMASQNNFMGYAPHLQVWV